MKDIERLYAENGYFGPSTAFDSSELECSEILPFVCSLTDGTGEHRNRHLDTPAVARICRSPQVVSTVQALLGPDLVLWRSNLFAVSTGGQGLPWHRDQYGGLIDCRNGASQCSVQINLSDSSRANCVAIVPGSHRWEDDELRDRGFDVVPGGSEGTEGNPVYRMADDARPVDMTMRSGQFYVFHPGLLHGSTLRVDDSSDHTRDSVRYSIALRIATPDARVLPRAFARTPSRATCVLFSGRDTTGLNPLGSWAE